MRKLCNVKLKTREHEEKWGSIIGREPKKWGGYRLKRFKEGEKKEKLKDLKVDLHNARIAHIIVVNLLSYSYSIYPLKIVKTFF